ncbi:hypothetical protein GCM10007301_47870 [Azorhizobium oxalatiphilum]|uniref:Uncharacterized protein n=1 Tax=Azorhizobium oxalatiphilum TaxID=980631 RepID=A0A917CBF8_9HYPH|nr:hypothetical protein [Azorhizobium oxalatiphilum]GGF82189.1 hypothetical protein GCM10007301_47870 [Azorhizobium oxalatiphilum]
MSDFRPLSFSSFDQGFTNLRQQAERAQNDLDIAGGVALLGITASGAAPQGQGASPGAAATPGQPSPGLLAAVQADPSRLTRLLSSQSPGARAMGAAIVERLNPTPRQGQFFQTADGVLYGDPNTQSVRQVYQSPAKPQIIQTQDGSVVAVDPRAQQATPLFQAGPKAPAGFQAKAGGGLEPIPGGPEDQAAVASRRAEQAISAGYEPGTPEFKSFVSTGKLPSASVMAAGQPKPLPAAALKMQNEDLEIIQAAQSINQQLGNAEAQITSGQLALGPMSNFISGAKNWVGNSDQNSRNYASFIATLEKVRNDSLRLNKGVQTEGDAVRAWNELFQNINDQKLVKQRIKEITGLNQQAMEFRQNRINQIRTNYGHSDLDAASVVPGAAPTAGAAPQTSQPSQARASADPMEGRTASGPNGQKLIRRNGQWVPLNGQ